TQWVSAEQTVVVGPDTLPTGSIPTVFEDPPQSGPYMAVQAGLRHFTQRFGPASPTEGVFLFRADMPFIGEGIEHLVEHHSDDLQRTRVGSARSAGELQPLFSYCPRCVAEQLFAQRGLDAVNVHTLDETEYRVVDDEADRVS